MKKVISSRLKSNRLNSIVSTLFCAGLIFVCSIAGLAQNGTQHTEYKADQTLRSNARVNPSTLAMEFSIPLANLPGRAGNSVPIAINYSSKVWEFKNFPMVQADPQIATRVEARYSQHSAAGWTSTMNVPRIDYEQYNREIYYVSDPGGANNVEAYVPGNIPDGVLLYYVKRVRVAFPGGSTVEFRKDDAVHGRGQSPSPSAEDKTGTFLSVDGSRMRLVMGTTDTVLYLPDGGRYIFAASSAPAHTFVDRHGNRMTLGETQTIDTLGRTIGNPVPLPLNPNQTLQTVQTAETKTYTYPGIGATREFKLIWDELDTVLDNGQALKYPGDYNCGPSPPTFVGNALFESVGFRACGGHSLSNPVVLTEVQLPDGSAYRFKYNSYGEITRIDYPTGGYEKFQYDYVAPVATGASPYSKSNRGVKFRWVSEGGAGATEREWKYEAVRNLSTYSYSVKTTAPDLSYTVQLLHDEPDDAPHMYGFSNAYVGRAYEERAYTAGGTLLRRKLTDWTQTGSLTINGVAGYSGVSRDLRPQKEISIIFEPTSPGYALAQMSETMYDTGGNSDLEYFSSLNPKQAKTSHYVALSAADGQPTTLSATAEINRLANLLSNAATASKTEMIYLYNPNYKARNISGLVTETSVIDPGTNQVKAKSHIDYDETNYLEGVMVTNLASWENPQTSLRGLPTTIRSWYDISGNQSIEIHALYDQFGNVRKSWDGKGNYSEIQYTDNYTDNTNRNSYALPTKTISFSGANGTGTQFETTVKYDFNTGLARYTTDVNNQVSELQYDAFLRPQKVIAPNGHQTITEYGEPDQDGQLPAAERFVKVKTQIDETRWKEGYSWFDGLGRVIKTQSVDSNGDVFTETEYDLMGRVKKVSNPYRNGETVYWTENTFDDLSRVIKVKTLGDNAEVNTAYSLATTGSQFGTVVTVTDQASKQRRSITNALGQLTRVDEPTGGGLGAINTPTQPTIYSYDLLNNLVQVVQNGTGTEQCGSTATSCSQTRTFTYDALSRLKSATNPETGTATTSGTINYNYDANGNLTKKTDPRGIKTVYDYDALNRVIKRCYTVANPQGDPANCSQLTTQDTNQNTLAVTYVYDDVTNAKGKLTKVITGNTSTPFSKTEYQVFDTMGRVTQSQQTTDGVTYPAMTYGYNLSGGLIEEKYPSGRVVKNELDADGGLSVVKSKKSQNAGYWNYAEQFTYTAAGAVSSMQLGNGTWESTTFNSRLQPTQIALGTVQNGVDKLKLNFDYGTTANNGNVLSQTITVATVGSNTGFTATQTYSYDSLNRINDAKEMIGTTQTWKQTFKYDRYGNRRFNTDNQNTTTFESSCPVAVCNPEVSPSKNRLVGYAFDNAGNTTIDAENRKYTYDGENKQVKAETVDAYGNPVSTIGEYWYDGDGKRVKKRGFIAGQWEETIFVYDASGRLVAEYSNVVEPAATANVSYLTNDHLGSPRITTNKDGAVISRRDFMPFGEEISTSQRTAGLGYRVDTVRQKFTAYERDVESDLDFAQARYYNPNHARFTSVDPVKMSSKRMRNPQQFNLYTYAVNNPLKYVDPDGEDNELVTEQREYTFSITKVDTVKGKKVTTQIDFKVTEKYVDIFNDKGEFVNTGIRVHVETSNGANAQNLLSDEKLTVAAQNAGGVIVASWQLGVDKSVALATASKETLMGAASGGPRSDGAVNPMQLTNGQFHPNTVRDVDGQIMQDTNKSPTDRQRNIYLSTLLLKQKIENAGSTEGGYRTFGPPPSQDPNYVSDSLKYNTQIKQSIDRTQKVTQPFVVNPK